MKREFKLIVSENNDDPRETAISNHGFSDLEMIGLLEVASKYIASRLVDQFREVPEGKK